jgi:hypothetical protein
MTKAADASTSDGGEWMVRIVRGEFGHFFANAPDRVSGDGRKFRAADPWV